MWQIALFDTSPLGCGLRSVSTERKHALALLPFICLVFGVLLAAPSTYQAEEHSGSLIVSVSQYTFVILITGSHGLPLITLHFTLHLGIALGKMDIFTISVC